MPEYHAVFHDKHDMLKGRDVLQRVPSHSHDVGEHSGGQMTYGSGLAQQFGGDRGPGFYGVHRCEARFFDQQLEFFRLVDRPGKGAGIGAKRDFEPLVFYFEQWIRLLSLPLFRMILEYEQCRAPIDSLGLCLV